MKDIPDKNIDAIIAILWEVSGILFRSKTLKQYEKDKRQWGNSINHCNHLQVLDGNPKLFKYDLLG